MTRFPARLRGDRRGLAIVEFAFTAPILILMVMGLSDLSYRAYVQSILTGALQKAGRDSTIQGSATRTAEINEEVMGMVRQTARDATFTATRTAYANYSSVNGEPFEDSSPPSRFANNRFDAARECFTDTNHNGSWDVSPGTTGQGGAGDVVVYEMTVTYPRLFPMAGLLGWSQDQIISAKTLLKNQPFADQAEVRRICP